MLKRPHLKRIKRQLISVNKWKLRLVFWGSTVLIGVLAALFAMGGAYADNLYYRLYAYSPFMAYSITPIVLATIVWLTQRYFNGAEGSGIPQIIAAASGKGDALRNAALSLRVAIGKIVLTCCGVLGGASIGTVGPTAHVSACMMYSVRRIYPMRSLDLRRALIMAGGAAGISAAFSNPLAGVLFAVEEIRKDMAERTRNTLIIAIVLAGLTTLAILGRYSYFGISSTAMPNNTIAWLAVLVCAISGGLLGGIFSQSLVFGVKKVAPLIARHPVFVAFGCGLVVSFLGYLSGGHIYGTGYAESQRLMAGGETSTAFPLLKMLATIASYLSGIPCGIFTPTLSIGAGLGAELSGLFSTLPVETLVLLGMVSYFTGVLQTPLTAFVIVMGMTNSSTMLMPLMVAALIARGVSHLVCPKPIYQALADAYLQRFDKTKSGS